MDFGGLDELDTQVKLYQLGIESFSPYASQGKVDMVVRAEKDEIVRYADVKVCSGVREDEQVNWKFDFAFFLENDSFLILSVRLPETDETMKKHYFVINSKSFLEIIKREKIAPEDNNWVLSLPYDDLQLLTKKTVTKKLAKLVDAFKPFFDNWQTIVEWKKISSKPKPKPKAKPKPKPKPKPAKTAKAGNSKAKSAEK